MARRGRFGSKVPIGMRRVMTSIAIALILCGSYLVAYCFLVYPNIPSYDKTGLQRSPFFVRGSGGVDLHGDVTITLGAYSWLNTVFYPAYSTHMWLRHLVQ